MRKNKKLSLNRETLRQLAGRDLRRAAGGGYTGYSLCFCPETFFNCEVDNTVTISFGGDCDTATSLDFTIKGPRCFPR